MNVMEEYADEDRLFMTGMCRMAKAMRWKLILNYGKRAGNFACDPGVIKIHIRIMQMENQLWIRACLKNPLIERTRQFV